MSAANEQVTAANKFMGSVTWPDGITLGFECVVTHDNKVQEKRAACGLYLFYGVWGNGTEMTYEELVKLATSFEISTIRVVKQQVITRAKFMKILKAMDDIDHISDV